MTLANGAFITGLRGREGRDDPCYSNRLLTATTPSSTVSAATQSQPRQPRRFTAGTAHQAPGALAAARALPRSSPRLRPPQGLNPLTPQPRGGAGAQKGREKWRNQGGSCPGTHLQRLPPAPPLSARGRGRPSAARRAQRAPRATAAADRSRELNNNHDNN